MSIADETSAGPNGTPVRASEFPLATGLEENAEERHTEQMASDSQIPSHSIFGRGRRRGAIGEDREGQNALVDSDEMQPPSQPLDHVMITHGSFEAMGNPGAREDQYRWSAEHASLVKEAYWEKGKNCLKDMVSKRKGGETVTAAKLFSKHIQSPRTRLLQMIDQRLHGYASNQFIFPSLVNEKYQSLKLAKQVPPLEEDNSLFLKVVSGWSEKGTIHGLGNSVSLFYEKPTNNATANKPSYTPSVVTQLQTKLDSTKTDLNSIKNEIQQQRTSREEQQQKMAE
ncbi:hypothetical protein Cgig2_025434 [Carnegiea gigantea]|uniref:Uncharacterized protein n=1 Tax=Carnegiea gigantea TaxID=171969 RepID=A0A9Q1QLV0_9CARY|nr:hypothetical protein Cgig2_025434 [Carnegiea gigantea]